MHQAPVPYSRKSDPERDAPPGDAPPGDAPPGEAPARDLPARFTVNARLGHGAFGVVYDAYDRERRSRVAVKTLRALTPDHLRALRHEFRTAQGLTHPNLVRLGELLEADGRWCFTMELVDGENILSYVQTTRGDVTSSGMSSGKLQGSPGSPGGPGRRAQERPPAAPRPFDERRLRSALRQLVSGLRALHGAGVVHRDVKPSNVLVARDGRVVLLDFGIALHASDDASADGVVGTPEYAAPEQLANEAVGPEADWYAVGVILYRALCGRLPFEGSALGVMDAKLRAPPPPLDASHLPPDLVALCHALLEPDPARRPSSVAIAEAVGDAEHVRDAAPAASFVGRHAELAALANALASTTEGGARAVVLRGPSGVGKSALARAFAGDAEQAGRARVLSGRCYEREFIPFKAVDAVVEQLVRFVCTERPELRERLENELHGLRILFPQLTVATDAPPPVSVQRPRVDNGREQRRLAFGALRTVLRAVGEELPLLVLVDDVQWADDDSLDLLSELVQQGEATRVLFLFTSRGVVSHERDAGALPFPATVLEVAPLPLHDARRLAEELLREAGGPIADAELLVVESGGHPMFLDELVQRRARVVGGGTVRLDEVVWERVEQLPEAARNVLEVVCLAGVPMEETAAALAARVEMAGLLGTMAALRTSRLVRSVGESRLGKVEAYHDRVREAVVARLDETRKKNLHRQIAAVLSSHDDVDPETLAHHWLAAGKKERAAELTAAAASQALRSLAFSRAASLFRMVLELGEQDEERSRYMRRQLVDALTYAGREAEAADVRLELARSLEPTQALDEKRRAAEQLLRSGHHDRGVVLLREVLQAAGVRFPESPLAVVVALILARLRLSIRGLALPPPGSTPTAALTLRVDAARSAGSGFSLSDNIRGAYFQSVALLHALATGDRARILYALGMEVCFVSVGGGRARVRTTKLLALTERLAREQGTPEALAILHVARGYTAYFLGQWAEAKRELAAAERRFLEPRVPYVFETNAARYILYRTLAFLGELRELRERLAVTFPDSVERNDALCQSNFRSIGRSLLALADGDVPRCRAELEEARRLLPQGTFLVQHYNHLVGELQADLYEGRGDLALARLAAAKRPMRRAHLMRLESVRVTLLDLRGRAALVAAAGSRGDERARWLAEARRVATKLERETSPWAQALALLFRAGLTEAKGDRAGAIHAYAEAIGALDVADLRLYAASARLRLGALRGRGAIDSGVGSAVASAVEPAVDPAVTEALGTFAAENVANPEALARSYAPVLTG